MRDHRRLEVFRLADSLAILVYQTTRSFPEDERYGLTSQMRRAAVSVGANIVEGAARSSSLEFQRMLNIAYSSACELDYQISLARRLDYVSGTEHVALERLASRTCRALRSLILKIQQGVSTRASQASEEIDSNLASRPVGQSAS